MNGLDLIKQVNALGGRILIRDGEVVIEDGQIVIPRHTPRPEPGAGGTGTWDRR